MDEQRERLKFQLLGVGVNVDSFTAILGGYIHHHREQVPDIFDLETVDSEVPFLSFYIDERVPKSHFIFNLSIHWRTEDPNPPIGMKTVELHHEGFADIGLVALDEKRANIFGEFVIGSSKQKTLVHELWAYIEKSVGLPPEQTGPKIPEKPTDLSNYDAWFDYYHAMKDAGQKYTLADLAKDVHRDEGYIRQLHTDYLKKKKWKT